MSVRSFACASVFLAAGLAAAFPAPRAHAEEAAKPSAATKPEAAPATPAADAKPSLTTAACEGTRLSVAWKGSGVAILDYLSAGEPRLQERKDPAPNDTSLEIALGDQWKGRKVDVRIWDKDAKLLDSKSTECKPAS